MEFQDVVRKRKMVRNFEDRPIIQRCSSGSSRTRSDAPSAGFSQGWAFLVLEGREATERYWSTSMTAERRAAFGWPGLFNAPVLIVCLSHKQAYVDRYAEPDKGWTDRDETRWPVPYWDIDTGMAALLILQTAVDAGLGALFFGVFDQAGVRAAFGIPDGYAAVGTIAIGHPAVADRPSPSLKRGHRPADAVIHRGQW